MEFTQLGSNQKRIIIISIILAVIVFIGVIAGVVIHNILVKKEAERLANATEVAKQVYENLVQTRQEQSDTFLRGDLFGYTIIIDGGDGYSDYLFMIEKTEEVEFKNKVNFKPETKTVTNKDKTEYLLLAPNGKRERIVKYDYVDNSEYNVEDAYVLYGNSRMGFFEEPEAEGEQGYGYGDMYDGDLYDGGYEGDGQTDGTGNGNE